MLGRWSEANADIDTLIVQWPIGYQKTNEKSIDVIIQVKQKVFGNENLRGKKKASVIAISEAKKSWQRPTLPHSCVQYHWR